MANLNYCNSIHLKSNDTLLDNKNEIVQDLSCSKTQFGCTKCNKKFRSISFYKRHCLNEHNFCEKITEFKCCQCQKLFDNLDIFDDHLKIYQSNLRHCISLHEKIWKNVWMK